MGLGVCELLWVVGMGRKGEEGNEGEGKEGGVPCNLFSEMLDDGLYMRKKGA